jgi:hypothetical protein
MVIQWSTWEREEWLIDDVYYQIGASGMDDVPEDHQQRYKEFVVDVDWKQKTLQAHNDIWQLHTELEDLGVNHIFFNGNNDFSSIKDAKTGAIAILTLMIPEGTYNARIRAKGIQTVHARFVAFW